MQLTQFEYFLSALNVLQRHVYILSIPRSALHRASVTAREIPGQSFCMKRLCSFRRSTTRHGCPMEGDKLHKLFSVTKQGLLQIGD